MPLRALPVLLAGCAVLAAFGSLPSVADTLREGGSLFRKTWVASGVPGADGLGPLYNARSCDRCHPLDRRGLPAGSGEAPVVLRLWLPGGRAVDPVYGRQLQDHAVPGFVPEGQVSVTWEVVSVPLSGGETAELRRPIWTVDALSYGPLAPGAVVSARAAPRLMGLGLLDAIPAGQIAAGADPDDADGDGISGRVHWVGDVPGRFGHKAEAPSLLAQSAAAFAEDMGLSTPLRPAGWGDCTAAQVACRTAPDGADPAPDGQGAVEVSADALAHVTAYTASLPVPPRLDPDNAEALRGEEIFRSAGCAACHRPVFAAPGTANGPKRQIAPHTDLLLHDMGEGLASAPGEAGREWRTPPLWGLRYAARYLHDGRARSVLEAILWHDGEGAEARRHVVELPPQDRRALLRFLGSL